MKRITPLLACAVLAAGLTPQISSGVLYTNQVQNIQARNVRVTLAPTTLIATGETYSQVNGSIRNQYTVAAGGQTGKAWIQFDLASTWAKYGQANLADAKLWLWNQNGSSRQFYVAGIADSAGLEGWNQTTLTWSNAPANDFTNPNSAAWGFDYSKCYGGTNLWMVITQPQGFDTSVPTVSQGALYISTNSNSKVFEFLQTDTDGKVTMGISDGPFNSNQTIPIGTNGTYAADPLAPNGYPSRSSPTLTMVFNVRVALVGGGQYCGGPGLDVSLASSDVGVNYLLYTNGVYAGQTIAGTGTNISFGLKTVQATYTAVASNTTTTATSAVLGEPVFIAAPTAPSITVQPVSAVAATNSVVVYSLTGAGDVATYAWYRNGVALTNGGQYSGVDTAELKISPVLASNAATTANGYYCVLTGICGNQAISTTNALTIQVARNLVWQGNGTNAWDIATTANWTNSAGAAVTFLQGDNVTLDDTAVDPGLAKVSPFLSPGTITFNASGLMGIGGSGDIAGPNTSLIVNGATLNSKLVISNANSFAGGTLINNGWVELRNLEGLGTGVITLGGSGASLLDVVPAGSASSFIPNGIHVTENSTLNYQTASAYAGRLDGPLTGTAGKTLTLQHTPNADDNFRLYNTDFTCDININVVFAGAEVGRIAFYNGSGNQVYNGVISGNVVLLHAASGGQRTFNGANTYGGLTLLNGGTVGIGINSAGDMSSGPLGIGIAKIGGNVALLASGGARTVGNPFTYDSTTARTLTISGTNQLTLSGTYDLAYSSATNGNVSRTITVSSTAPAILSGVIGDQGFACGITKSGNGSLYLNNAANTYTGATTNTAGLLAGTGNVPGALVVTGGQLGGGSPAAIGTLTVGGSATFANGGGLFRVNRSGLQSDKVTVAGALANTGTGTITITNLGAALQAGDTFTLFNKPVTGGNTMKITGAGANWVNNLAVNGTVQVLNIIATYPTNITTSVSGNTLNLSWPVSHLSWSLQAQTNSLNVGIANNWVTIPGTAGVTSTNITINPANPAVFYRLFYAAP